MCSNLSDFLRLRENLKQLIIGEEIESCKVGSFLFKIVSKTFLDDFQVFVRLLERVFESISGTVKQNAWVFLALAKDKAPLVVDTFKSFGLSGQLFHDIW
jgi:hypothetical protein